MVETRTFEQLPETDIAQGTDLLGKQSPGGPMQSIALARLIGRLGPVDLVSETLAGLDLAHAAGSLAIVWGDADPSNLGYYVKTGAPGAGGWVYSDVFRGFSAYQIAVAQGFVGDVGAWLASLHGADGPAGTKYRFGGSIEASLDASAVVLRHVFQADVNFADDFVGAIARRAPGVAAPGANQVLPIEVEGIAIGSLTVLAAGGFTFVTTGGALACVRGNEFRMKMPAAAPAAELVGLSFTFAGTEVV